MSWAWWLLTLSSVLNVGWLACVRRLTSIRDLGPLAGMVVFGLSSTFCFARCLKSIPASIAYAAFTGLSVSGSLVFDVLVRGKTPSALAVGFILLIVVGTAGLQIVS